MKLVKLDQYADYEAWQDFRRGKISGSKAGKLKPLTRPKDALPIGFWELLADKLAIAKDGEPERERGLRLEQEAIRAIAKRYKLKMIPADSIWVSDHNENIMVSPDGHENSDTITYACEIKCLDSKNHIKIIVEDLLMKKGEAYNPFDAVPKKYQDQLLQYFIVNENLKTLYFTLYDDRMAFSGMTLYTIKINRADIDLDNRLELAEQNQVEMLKQVKSMIELLLKELGE